MTDSVIPKIGQSTLRVFRFKDTLVRVLQDDMGAPWWVAKDVCDALGLRNPTVALGRLDSDERSKFNLGRQGEVNVVSESGLYSLVLTSRKPEAREFKRWVTHEVLPSIRKRGGYLTPEATEKALTDPDFIIQLATQLKEERAHREALEAQRAIDAPKANYFDEFIADEDLIQFRTLANQLGIKETALREFLISRKWIYRISGKRWSNKRNRVVTVHQYRAYAEKKHLFRLVPCHEAPRINGEVQQALKMTPRGAEAVARLVHGPASRVTN